MTCRARDVTSPRGGAREEDSAIKIGELANLLAKMPKPREALERYKAPGERRQISRRETGGCETDIKALGATRQNGLREIGRRRLTWKTTENPVRSDPVASCSCLELTGVNLNSHKNNHAKNKHMSSICKMRFDGFTFQVALINKLGHRSINLESCEVAVPGSVGHSAPPKFCTCSSDVWMVVLHHSSPEVFR